MLIRKIIYLAYSTQIKMRMFKRKSYMQELVEYIKKNLKKGYTKDLAKNDKIKFVVYDLKAEQHIVEIKVN